MLPVPCIYGNLMLTRNIRGIVYNYIIVVTFYSIRIQAVACSPSTPMFAVSSVGSLSYHSQTITSKLTFGLTSPTLPSQLMKPNEMLMMTKRPHSLSSPHGLYEPTPGELTIWDVNVQKIQVMYYDINV